MGNFIRKLSDYVKSHRNLVIITMVAIFLEVISAAQYYYTHNLLEDELDNRAESELRIKAILIRSILDIEVRTVSEHIWDIHRNINHPDSMFDVTKRMITNSKEALGCCLAFTPNYYPQKGRLFEPYAFKKGKHISVGQLGEEGIHDYTQHPAYQKMVKEMKPFWSDPYEFESDSVMPLTTYSYPLIDSNNKLAAVCGLDLSLEHIGDTLNARHIYPSSFDILLTKTGEIISRPSVHHPKYHDVETAVKMINDSTVKRYPSKSGKSQYILFESEKDGSNGVIYFANMRREPRWQVVVVCYDQEVYGSLYWMRINILALMLLAFGFLGYIIHKYAHNEKELHIANIKQERIDSELRIAQNIQMEMLPKQFPPYPDRNDIQIFGSLVPAKEVGGDIFDFLLRDEKLFFCIGDVSGKGIPSAIIMSGIHTLFRMASVHEKDPSRIMHNLNIASCENNETNIFVTFFIGVLDLPTGRLRYCNAGHDIPFIISDDNGVSLLPVEANIPIGLFEDFNYEKQEIYLKQATTLFLYTDGLTEAKNKTHKQFGMNRVEEVLRNNTLKTPEEVIEKMNGQVHLFMENAAQSDDLTMLSIKYTPNFNEFHTKEELKLKNDVRCVKELNAFVKSITDKLGIGVSQARNIKLAVEEAVVNVMDYAYPIGTEGDIILQVMYNKEKLKFVIIDSGIAFDPTQASKADTTLSVEDRPVGGLGLLLVREMMETINYERIDNKNRLTLITHYSKDQ